MATHVRLYASGGPCGKAPLGPRSCVHQPPCEKPGCQGRGQRVGLNRSLPVEVCFRLDARTWLRSADVNPPSVLPRLHSYDVRGVNIEYVSLTFKQKVLIEQKQSILARPDGAALIIQPRDKPVYDQKVQSLKNDLKDPNASDLRLAELPAASSWAMEYSFRASRWVGRLAVAGAVIDIAPKQHVPISKLALLELLLLTLSGASLPLDDHAVSGLPHGDVALLLAYAYSAALETALQHTRGAICDYLSVRELCSFIRGRIDLRASLKRPHGLDYPPLVCSYDELTIDTPQNQLLKSATQRVLALLTAHATIRPDSASVLALIECKLRKTERMLGGVARREFTTERELAAVELYAHHPRYRHYQQPLQLAKRILAASSTEACGGQVGVSLLVNMDTVFEDFVRCVFSEVVPVKKGGDALGGERNAVCPLSSGGADCGVHAREAKPDMVSCDTALRAIVGDAKHKRLHVSEQGKLITIREDVYQMLSYNMSHVALRCGVRRSRLCRLRPARVC